MITTIIDWFRKWREGRIIINVTYVTDGVNTTRSPRTLNKTVHINEVRKSNFRFCEYVVQEPGDKEQRTYYYTEVYKDGRWNRVENTWFADKTKAMEAHIAVMDGATFETKKIETVLWEGLSREETEVWVNLQKEYSNG